MMIGTNKTCTIGVISEAYQHQFHYNNVTTMMVSHTTIAAGIGHVKPSCMHASRVSCQGCPLVQTPSGLAWSLYKCSALWRAVDGPSATERPLGTIREE